MTIGQKDLITQEFEKLLNKLSSLIGFKIKWTKTDKTYELQISASYEKEE